MGRGNICTTGKYEGLYYLDRELVDTYTKLARCECCGRLGERDEDEDPMTARELRAAGIEYDFDGKESGWAYDEFLSRESWDEMVEFMTRTLEERFPSFCRVKNVWSRGEYQVVLQNKCFEIAVADNEWSAAWMLLERSDIWDFEMNLGATHAASYLEGIKKALLDGFGEATEYGGAWTHGKTHRREEVKKVG